MAVCPMCGDRYDPVAASACASCPLGAGCTLVCCPSCGYGEPDPERSVALRLVRGLGRRLPRRGRVLPAARSLAHVHPGDRARIDTLEHVPEDRREQLLAYGVAPGRVVDVLQSRPVTIVRIEHTELALERSLSRTILVAASAEGSVL